MSAPSTQSPPIRPMTATPMTMAMPMPPHAVAGAPSSLYYPSSGAPSGGSPFYPGVMYNHGPQFYQYPGMPYFSPYGPSPPPGYMPFLPMPMSMPMSLPVPLSHVPFAGQPINMQIMAQAQAQTANAQAAANAAAGLADKRDHGRPTAAIDISPASSGGANAARNLLFKRPGVPVAAAKAARKKRKSSFLRHTFGPLSELSVYYSNRIYGSIQRSLYFTQTGVLLFDFPGHSGDSLSVPLRVFQLTSRPSCVSQHPQLKDQPEPPADACGFTDAERFYPVVDLAGLTNGDRTNSSNYTTNFLDSEKVNTVVVWSEFQRLHSFSFKPSLILLTMAGVKAYLAKNPIFFGDRILKAIDDSNKRALAAPATKQEGGAVDPTTVSSLLSLSEQAADAAHSEADDSEAKGGDADEGAENEADDEVEGEVGLILSSSVAEAAKTTQSFTRGQEIPGKAASASTSASGSELSTPVPSLSPVPLFAPSISCSTSVSSGNGSANGEGELQFTVREILFKVNENRKDLKIEQIN